MYAHNQKIRKPNNIEVLESNKANGSKQNSQNRLRSPMSEGDEQ